MDGTILLPSPNWFQVSVFAVSKNGYLVYGGPSKSLCVLAPIGENQYQAHVVNRAHTEKITSVDISREWTEKLIFLTGSADGRVKQWSLESYMNTARIRATHCLDIHHREKEDMAGVGYSSAPFAITVGTYGNIVKWDLKSNVAKTYNKFLKNFKPVCIACSYHVPLNVAVGTKQGVVFVLDLNGEGKTVYKVRCQDDEIVNVSWCPQYEVLLQKSFQESVRKSSAMERLEIVRSEPDDEFLNESGITKSLPDDSFDESIVQEDDTFDIYKDHEADEFGHKKFESKDILVKVKEEKKPDDFLVDCLKLKEDILKMKNDPEPTVDNLAEALHKTHVDSDIAEIFNVLSPVNNERSTHSTFITSAHIQKHLLATIGKLGGVKVWSKSGKLVANCMVPNQMTKNNKNKGPSSSTLLWYKPDVLLIADGKGQVLECNPLLIDCKNKLQWKVLHSLHKRGLYCIAAYVPHVRHTDEWAELSYIYPLNEWKVWTVAQDRNIICYSMQMQEMVAAYNTCGGFLYTIKTCPYNAKRIAVSVGDGAVRVWDTDIVENDMKFVYGDVTKLSSGDVTSYWQNVQGKVLTLAWHPTRENLIAFSTAESRVGLIDASNKLERPAKNLVPYLRGGIYSLCWGEGYDLYVAGGGQLVMYRANKPDADPIPINVELEGQKWDLCASMWYPTGFLCGSNSGGVAVLDPYTKELLSVVFVFSKMIHSLEWHPQQTSSSNEESPYKDLIAVSSLDKSYEIAILEYVDKGDGLKLHKLKTLNGHKYVVLQLAWNPHKDMQLLSTSHDSTIRVWNVLEGVCIAIYGGHIQSSLGAVWCAFPQLPSTIMSGGADCCLRVWKVEDYPPEIYTEIKHEAAPKKEKKNKIKAEENKEEQQDVNVTPHTGQKATSLEKKVKVPKHFLLPTMHKQMSTLTVQGLRKMFEKFIVKENNEDNGELKYKVDKEGINVAEPKINYINGVSKCDIVDANDEPKSGDMESSGASKSAKMDSNDEFDNPEMVSNDNPDSGEIETNVNEVTEDQSEYIDFLKMFGSYCCFSDVLDLEMRKHIEYRRFEAWVMLAIFRGHIEDMIQFTSQRDALCPFLVSLSPCLSFKYWKNVTQLYLTQIERLVAKGEEHKISETKWYGGPIYKRVALLLSIHDVKGAVAVLVDACLFKEAYVLARARHMDSIAQETLQTWAVSCLRIGLPATAAMCYLALGDPYKAAVTLAKSNDQEHLSLAAELAKAAGQSTFATHIEDKKSSIISETPETDHVEDLRPLPTKIDLLKGSIQIGASDSENKD